MFTKNSYRNNNCWNLQLQSGRCWKLMWQEYWKKYKNKIITRSTNWNKNFNKSFCWKYHFYN